MDKRVKRRGWYAAAAALVAGGAAAAFAVGGAGAAPTANAVLAAASGPGWRITKVLPNVTAGGLWAGSARDAWLAGDECADPATCGDTDESPGTVVIRHWDGTAWRVVTPPQAYVDSDLDQGAEAVVATSASNAWVFAGRGTQGVDYTDALHWTGQGWAKPVRIGDTMVQAAAGAAGQVWVFGTPLAYGQVGLVAHYNGKSWSHGPFPLNGTAAAALSVSDVWAGGTTTTGLGIEHWNGHAWRATPLPSLGLGSLSPAIAAFVTGITAVSAADVWAVIGTYSSTGTNPPGTIVLHWDGSRWTRVGFPYRGSADSPVAADGHGGIWLATSNGSGAQATDWICHDSGGHWTRTAVTSLASDIFYLAWIPGTRSLWAAGDQANTDYAVILKYGP
jgi:hypothetical protein